MNKWILAAILAFAFCAVVPAQVVINEFIYDDCTTDDEEYVELYNASSQPVDIGGWMLECLDGAWPFDDNPDFMIPMGTILMPHDFYVMGSPLVPNVDQVIGTVAILENDEESMVLRNAMGQVIDQVTYESNKVVLSQYPAQFIDGQGVWGAGFSLTLTRQAWARWTDGYDTDDNGRDFGLLLRSPGTTNAITIPTAHFNDYTAQSIGANAPFWRGTFAFPKVIDPGVTGQVNPTVIPPSPGSGGRCMIVDTPSGGSCAAIWDGAPAQDFLFEAWVYFRGSNPCPQFETWSIGVRGTTETIYFHTNPDSSMPPCGSPFGVPGQVNPQANGNTGFAWEYISMTGFGVLRLVDENNGGGDQTVHGEVFIFPGMNDGWQRVRLECHGDTVVGTFGGTYGSPVDGMKFAFKTNYMGLGTVYCGYRITPGASTSRRPLTMDDVNVAIAAAPFTTFFTEPNGPGSIALEFNGMMPGLETFCAVSLEPCPGFPGTGPYLGLCATDINTLLNQVLLPLGTFPFHFIASGSTALAGPLNSNLLPPGLVIEVAALQANGAQIVNVAPATRFVN